MKKKMKKKNSNVKNVSELLKDQNEFVRKMAETTTWIFEEKGFDTDFVNDPIFTQVLDGTLKRIDNLYEGVNTDVLIVYELTLKELAFLLTDDEEHISDVNCWDILLKADKFREVFEALLYLNNPNRHKEFLSTLLFTAVCVTNTAGMSDANIIWELIKSIVEPYDIGFEHLRK